MKQRVEFKNSHGQKIVGSLFDLGKDFIVIHCHGYGTTKESLTAVSIGEEITSKGMSYLCFDFFGSGESDGKINDMTVSSALDDLSSAIKFLKKIGFINFSLSGSSFGGGVVLNHATSDKDIRSVALKAPVSDYCSLPLEELDLTERADDFLKDAAKYIIYDKAQKILCPVLIIHGDNDTSVPLNQSQKTCSLIKNCSLEVVKGGNHKLADHRKKFSSEFAKFFEENK